MTQQFSRILCPVDFDDNSMLALDTAANLARDSNGTVFILHVVPIIVERAGDACLRGPVQRAGGDCSRQAARDRAQAARRTQVRSPHSYRGEPAGHHPQC